MNLIEALEAHGIEFKYHTSRENELYINCPFCIERGETPDRRFRFGVNYVTGQAHCFNCGKKFRDVEYLKKALKDKLDTGEWELSQETIKKERLKTPVVKLPEDFIALSEVGKRTHWDNVALNYLHKRGVTWPQIQQKNIGYSMVGDFRYRIVIPVYYQGKLEGIVARAFVADLEPKYRNSLGNKTLFNVPKKMGDTCVLSEGAFDALAIERVVHNMDSEAVLGHTLTERQLDIVKHYDRIILWCDPDTAGVEGLIRMGQQLLNAGKERVDIVEPRMDGTPEYDPSELDGHEIRKALNNVKRYSVELGQSLRLKVAFQET
jgi:DNA primase